MATILVMEDDDLVRDLIVRILEMYSYEVLPFPDAAPALQTADFDRIDLIITDLTMPTPGEEAIRAIRARGIQTPILVISGQLQAPKARYLTRLGAQSVMSKPFLLQDLIERVRTLLAP